MCPTLWVVALLCGASIAVVDVATWRWLLVVTQFDIAVEVSFGGCGLFHQWLLWLPLRCVLDGEVWRLRSLDVGVGGQATVSSRRRSFCRLWRWFLNLLARQWMFAEGGGSVRW